MCCVCESSDSVYPFAYDGDLEVLIQVQDGPEISQLVVYYPVTDDEAHFDIRYCPFCGKRLKNKERWQ